MSESEKLWVPEGTEKCDIKTQELLMRLSREHHVTESLAKESFAERDRTNRAESAEFRQRMERLYGKHWQASGFVITDGGQYEFIDPPPYMFEKGGDGNER